mgnify:CR=1 FL=1
MYEWNSTIDTWMIDAFYPSLRKASTAKEWDGIKGKLMSNVVSYRYMARLVAKEAKNLNLLPHELQALIWVASQIRQTGARRASDRILLPRAYSDPTRRPVPRSPRGRFHWAVVESSSPLPITAAGWRRGRRPACLPRPGNA